MYTHYSHLSIIVTLSGHLELNDLCIIMNIQYAINDSNSEEITQKSNIIIV